MGGGGGGGREEKVVDNKRVTIINETIVTCALDTRKITVPENWFQSIILAQIHKGGEGGGGRGGG